MDKLTVDKRFENAINAFFEARPTPEDYALSVGKTETTVHLPEAFTEKSDTWTGFLRQIMLFVPGAFMLYYAALAAIFFYEIGGMTFAGLFMIFNGAFLCYASSGSLRNAKNLVLPGAVLGMAIVVAAIASLFPRSDHPNLYFWYSIYLFPIVLVVPQLLRSWLKDK